MDNFMDKIAQKFNAGELIKANSQAEAEEMKRMQQQVAAYENILQEIRKVNLKNAEITQKMETQVEHLLKTNEELQEKNEKMVTKALDEVKKVISQKQEEEPSELLGETLAVETKKILEEGQLKIEELFQAADEYVHRENVKVYRNVQAVVVDEMKNQTEALDLKHESIDKKINILRLLTVGTIILSLANTIVLVVQMFL